MPSILDQPFSIRQAGEALKHPNRSELLDRPFTLREAGNTAKELFGGACCQSCGAVGGRLPIRTVVHDYDISGEGATLALPKGIPKTKRRMKVLRNMQENPKVFKRGSAAAKEHMAALRAMRGQKSKPFPEHIFPIGSEGDRQHMAALKAMGRGIHAAQEEYGEVEEAPKKRTGRFAKGSPEAKAFMAELRARRRPKA